MVADWPSRRETSIGGTNPEEEALPVWAVIILVLGSMVIWAVTVHGHDIESRIES